MRATLFIIIKKNNLHCIFSSIFTSYVRFNEHIK